LDGQHRFQNDPGVQRAYVEPHPGRFSALKSPDSDASVAVSEEIKPHFTDTKRQSAFASPLLFNTNYLIIIIVHFRNFFF
ncbi:MAG TPA: hypothetical protein PLV51_03770, partial [Lentimicrobium sp.]|nr:hypothetical protein [Lentimicrobium sp.]